MHKQLYSIYRPKEVCNILGCSNTTLKRLVKAGLIKKPVKIGSRFVGFPIFEIEAFIKKRIEERDNA